MKEEYIRDAFFKVKQDMEDLRYEIKDLKELIKELFDEKNTQKLHEIHENNLSTIRQQNTTNTVNTTANTTVPQEIQGLKHPNLRVSIGNEGASTDRQTDRQTDNTTAKIPNLSNILNPKKDPNPQDSIETNIQQASEILDSLDNIKKQIRFKFKKVTEQEMRVFSTIYQLEEQEPKKATYKYIAAILKLSQSSIRDYVQRMINKGIPIKKFKHNNQQITLSISPELKKIATLATIIQLREL